MPEDRDSEKIKAALSAIKGYQARMGGTESSWRLDIPLWRLASEGLLVLLLGFVCGKGLGIIYQFIFG